MSKQIVLTVGNFFNYRELWLEISPIEVRWLTYVHKDYIVKDKEKLSSLSTEITKQIVNNIHPVITISE